MEKMSDNYKEFFHGYFCLPESQDEVHGNLFILQNNKAILEILDDFEDTRNEKLKKPFNAYPEIHGIAFNNSSKKQAFFYLFNVRRIQYSFGNINRNNFTVQLVFVGNSIKSLSSFKATRLHFSSEAFNYWVDSLAIKIHNSPKNTLDVSLNKTETIFLFSNSDYILNIFFNAIYNYQDRRNLHLSENVYFEIILPNQIGDFRSILRLKTYFDSFFSALFEKRFEFSTVSFFDEDDVAFDLINSPYTEQNIYDIKYPYVSFIDSAHSLIDNWFNFSGKLPALSDTFFDSYFDDQKSLNSFFLTSVFCLELIYRHVYPVGQTKTATYLRNYEEILSLLKGENKTWFEKKLNPKKDSSLSEKLGVLFSDCSHFPLGYTLEQLITKTVETRNCLVHLDLSKVDILSDADKWHVSIFYSNYIRQYIKKQILSDDSH